MKFIFDGQLEKLNSLDVSLESEIPSLIYQDFAGGMLSSDEGNCYFSIAPSDSNPVKDYLIPLLKRGKNVMFNLTFVSESVDDNRFSFQGCSLNKVSLDGKFEITLGTYVDI